MSYRNNLEALNPFADSVEQFKSCQCGWAWYGSNAVAYSYDTIVGAVVNGIFYRTTEKYSVTTTRQLNAMAACFRYLTEDVDTEQLQALANQVMHTAKVAHS